MKDGVRRFGDDTEFGYIIPLPGPTGELRLHLESQPYITEAGFGRSPSMYPVTIVQARYGGTYEGGSWLAFPVDPGELGREGGWRGWDGSDIQCNGWHITARLAGWPVGRGDSPVGAYADLLKFVADAGEVGLEQLVAAPVWPRQAQTEGGATDAGEG